MINRVVLVGRLTRDPELRKTQSGTSVCSFTMAVGRRVSTQGQPDADFINCVAWNKTADLMTQYLHKGSLIGLEGRIQTRSYDNQQGQRVYVTEVVSVPAGIFPFSGTDTIPDKPPWLLPQVFRFLSAKYNFFVLSASFHAYLLSSHYLISFRLQPVCS